MKKTILYTIAAISIAAIAALAIVGCNNGDNSDSEGLNRFLGSLVNRDPGETGGSGYKVTVKNGRTASGVSNYAEGQEVVIMTDKEQNGQRFIEWTSPSEGVAIDNPRNVITSFTMPPREVTVTANFGSIPRYAVTYDGNENNGGSTPEDQNSPYDSGATVTVLGYGDLSKNGHYFSGWGTQKDGGRQLGVDETFTITEPTTLYAKWKANTVTSYTVTVTGGSGGGKRTAGEAVTVTAENKTGYTFKNWTASPNVDFNNANAPTATFSMPASDVSVTANFDAEQKYKVTVNSASNNATGSGSYAEGATVSIYAGTASGKTFKSWTVNSGGVSLANPTSQTTSFTMPANEVTVTANFDAAQTQTYFILSTSVKPDKSGSVSLDPEQLKEGYASGASVKATATAESGYEFTGWSGASTATDQSVTIKMDGAKTLTANFKIKGSTEPATKPGAPTNVTAEMTSASSITVKWDAVSNATGYVVYRSRTNVVYNQVGDVNGGTVVSYADNSATKGLGYYYKVSARNSSGESDKSSSISIAMVDNDQKCGTYCLWGGDAGCTDLVADPTGNYNSNDYWPPQPTPTCDSANTRCIRDGAGLYDNPTCTGSNLGGVLKNEFCNKYCIWDYACSEIKTDRNGVYGGSSSDNCANQIKSCENISTPRRTFNSMEECVRIGKENGWYKDPGARSAALSKSRASSLRAIYTNGTVEATLTLPAAPKLSGGTAELIDDKSGATVSSAPVTASGKKVTAVLDASAVSGGYYTVRVVLINKDGGRSVEEASIGIVK